MSPYGSVSVFFRKTQAAILLIKLGADVHIQAHNGVTAFDMAMLISKQWLKLRDCFHLTA